MSDIGVQNVKSNRERGLTLITYLRLLLQVGGGPAQVRPEKKVSVS